MTAREVLLRQFDIAAARLASDPSQESREYWIRHLRDIVEAALLARAREIADSRQHLAEQNTAFQEQRERFAAVLARKQLTKDPGNGERR